MRPKMLRGLLILCLILVGLLSLAGNAAAQMEGLGLAFCCGTGIFLMFLPLIINIIIAVYCYKDAKKRGMSGAMWGAIGFFLNIIGLIIYLVVRRSHPVQPEGPPMGAPPGPGGYPPPPQYPQ